METSLIKGKVVCHLQYKIKNRFNFLSKHYSLKQGLGKFGMKAKNSATKKLTQLQDIAVFTPIKMQDLNKKEKAKAMESLITLVKKKDGSFKSKCMRQQEYST